MERVSTSYHGIERRDGDGLWWHQYWKGIRHTWYFHGIPLWTRMRKRDRPMHEFVKRIAS